MEIKAYINDEQADEKISEHFRVREFACRNNSPVTFIDEYLVTLLELLRKRIGKPINITSGYRTPEHNKLVGGSKYSYHIRGMAADIRVTGVSPKEVAKALNKIVPNTCGIIVYDSWTHIDTRVEKYRKGV